jgi:hypothetical protein
LRLYRMFNFIISQHRIVRLPHSGTAFHHPLVHFVHTCLPNLFPSLPLNVSKLISFPTISFIF